jgi:hypothetical protein
MTPFTSSSASLNQENPVQRVSSSNIKGRQEQEGECRLKSTDQYYIVKAENKRLLVQLPKLL